MPVSRYSSIRVSLRVLLVLCSASILLALSPQSAAAVVPCWDNTNPPTNFQGTVGDQLVLVDDIEQEVLLAVIDWGDGGTLAYSGILGEQVNLPHTYTAPGVFTILGTAQGVVNGQPCVDLDRFLGTATITRPQEDLPRMMIADASTVEGDSGQTQLRFPVQLSKPAPDPATVAFSTANGSAVAPSDFRAASGSLHFAAGQSVQQVVVSVAGDRTYEPDEAFSVRLAGGQGVVIADGEARGTIINDDPLPQARIGDVDQAEGTAQTTVFAFPVTLSNPSSEIVTLHYATSNDSAAAPGDYATRIGDLTFAPGETDSVVEVGVVGDDDLEADERFTVTLSNPSNATIAAGGAVGAGTIRNDDAAVINVTSFIPANYLVGPPTATCFTKGRKVDLPPEIKIPGHRLIFHGDDRTFDRTSDRYRTRQLVTALPTAAGSPEPQPTVHTLVGETTSYAQDALLNGRIDLADNDAALGDCHLRHEVGVGSTSDMHVTVERTGGFQMRIHVFGGVQNPLVLAAPAIDYDFVITVDTSTDTPSWTLRGAHDGFPAYEIYMGDRPLYRYDPGPAPYTQSQLVRLFPPLDVTADIAGTL